jgi:hypothetical protein
MRWNSLSALAAHGSYFCLWYHRQQCTHESYDNTPERWSENVLGQLCPKAATSPFVAHQLLESLFWSQLQSCRGSSHWRCCLRILKAWMSFRCNSLQSKLSWRANRNHMASSLSGSFQLSTIACSFTFFTQIPFWFGISVLQVFACLRLPLDWLTRIASFWIPLPLYNL